MSQRKQVRIAPSQTVHRTLIVLIASLLLAGSAWAQVNRGTITGIITDPSGAAIPGATVSVTDQLTGVTTTVTTSSAGNYAAPNLAPSTYTVSVEAKGFKKSVQKGIVVGVGDTIRANVLMTIGATTESVQVNGQAVQIQRDTAELGTVITGQEVEELPLTSTGDQRTPASFMSLSPGVTGRGNSDGGPGSNQYMTTSVGGSIVSSTTLKLDGADFPTVTGFEGNLTALQIPPDAIGEFKLEATNPPAEYGRSVGGSASFVMKSGTNQIHGTGYEYVRNTDLNANQWFTNAAEPGCEANGVTAPPAGYTGPLAACKSIYKHNEFGVTAGGPIKKDKAFIFGYYDGLRLIQSNSSSSNYYIPTAAQLQGNFTVDPGLPTLYDPTTHTTCGPEICNNKLTSSTLIDPVSAKVVPLFPAPTSSGVVNGVFTGLDYTSTTASPLSVNMWGLKGDYNVNDKNRIAVTFATGKNETPNIPGIPPPLQGGDQPSINQTRDYRVNWNLIARPNLINQVTLSLDTWNSGTEPIASYGGKSNWIQYLGLGGLEPLYGTEFPQINLGSFAYDGGGGASFTNTHGEGIQDSLTWVKSKHTIKSGFQWMKTAENSVSSGRSNGYFQFLPNYTGLASNPATGYATASFLLGVANEEEASYIFANSYDRVGYWAAFAQDDYKVTRKLTLNLGVRWDMYTPDFQKYYHKGWVDPSVPNTSLSPNIQGAFIAASPSDPTGVNTYKRNFSPRIGFAYAVNDKTVVRGGYGIMYGQGNATQLGGSALVQGFNGNYDLASGDVVWSKDPAVPFVPSFTPATFLGQGTPLHSAGSLIELQRTDGLPPYTQNFNVTVERQLASNTTLTAGYVGNTGIHLPSRGLAPMDKMPPQYLTYGNQCDDPTTFAMEACTVTGATSLLLEPISDPNVQAAAPIAAMPIDPATGHHSPFAATTATGSMGFEELYSGAAASVNTMGQALRTNPQYQGLHRYYESLGVSTYNALQMKLDHRFSNGLTLLTSYAWSKTLTDAGSMFSTFSSEFGSTTPWNRHDQKGVGFEDMPNNLAISYIYDLPVGQGRKFMNRGGVANAVIGGWKYSGILKYQTGLPVNFDTSPSEIPDGLEDNGHNNANQILGVPLRDPSSHGHFNPTQDEWFNEKAFEVPPAWTFGTMTPTTGAVRSPHYYNEDMSLMKDWNFTLIHDEPMTLRLNADFFNIFNRTIFGLTGENGAYAQEPYINNPGFGALGGQTNYPRQVQFALRLKW